MTAQLCHRCGKAWPESCTCESAWSSELLSEPGYYWLKRDSEVAQVVRIFRVEDCEMLALDGGKGLFGELSAFATHRNPRWQRVQEAKP